MPDIKDSLKMILEGTISDDLQHNLYLHECEYNECVLMFESYYSKMSLKDNIERTEKLLQQIDKWKQEVHDKEWKFSNPKAELEKLDAQKERLNEYLQKAKHDEALSS